IASLFNLQVLTALPFNSDVFENLSRGVVVLEHQKDPLTRKFTELAENMIGIIDRALEGEESYDHGSTPQTVGELLDPLFGGGQFVSISVRNFRRCLLSVE